MASKSEVTAVEIDTARCAGHGRCGLTAPEVFGYDDEIGQALVLPDADVAAHAAEVDVAIAGCPEAAIRRVGG